jgi:hypothetical protein
MIDTQEITRHAETETSSLLSLAQHLIVRTAEQAEKAGRLRAEVRARERAIEEWFKPHKQNLDRTKRALLEEEKRVLSKYEQPRSIIDQKLAAYHKEQERLRQEAIARALEEERRREEAERARLRAEAEARGDQEAVARAETAPILLEPVATPIVSQPKLSRTAFVEHDRAECYDIRALCRAVADGSVPSDLVLPNQSRLNALARALKSAFRVPGCRIVKQTMVRSRAVT